MKQVKTGLQQLRMNAVAADDYQGNVGYLCHSASIDEKLNHGIEVIQGIFGNRLKKLFSPQHGLVSDVQDNMIESQHYFHKHFRLPVFSLYSDTRRPTDEMLENLDVVFIDLQDVGTRVYTYIQTMLHFMEACVGKDIKLVILDRPNPINGLDVEGNVLDMNFKSFVGLYEMPMRHGMTMGEVAMFGKKHCGIDCQVEVISIIDWDRSSYFEDCGIPWVFPSPNLPTVDTAVVYPGTVLFEGCNFSEGRGTTRSLEIVGHPGLDPHKHHSYLTDLFAKSGVHGVKLRPLHYIPTFQKHMGHSCGGYQIHTTDRNLIKPWRACQVLFKGLKTVMGDSFQWKTPPYEYEFNRMPIDILNGTDKLRHWVDNAGSMEALDRIEEHNMDSFLEKRASVLIY